MLSLKQSSFAIRWKQNIPKSSHLLYLQITLKLENINLDVTILLIMLETSVPICPFFRGSTTTRISYANLPQLGQSYAIDMTPILRNLSQPPLRQL